MNNRKLFRYNLFMKFVFLASLFLFFYMIPLATAENGDQEDAVPLHQTGTAVKITDRGVYYFVEIDMTSGISHKTMGEQYALAVKEAVPNCEALLDSYLMELILGTKLTLAQCLERVSNIRPSMHKEYSDELDGMATVFNHSVDKLGDNKLSAGEIWCIALIPDIMRLTQCCAISAFSDASETGTTITGRNTDWFMGSKHQMAFLHAVTLIKNGSRSICLPGFLGFLSCVTGFNKNGIFGGILDSDTGELPYVTLGKRSYTYDLRYALETESTLYGVANYMNDKPYAFNHLIFLSSPRESKVLENYIHALGDRRLRSDNSHLQEPSVWGFSNVTGTVNSFLLPGNPDNQTPWPQNTARWESMKQQTALYSINKIGFEDIKNIISYYPEDLPGPGTSSQGCLYREDTAENIIFEPATFKMEMAFAPSTGEMPVKPVFHTIFASNPFESDEPSSCASFDSGSNLLHIPCINLGNSSSYWCDMKLEGDSLIITGFGEN
ncbi:MAG: hypothetical protein B6242_14395 [Anaerolineaceae bacterium 4572_78]|nr:MAG: hypothetical protein B6242_14395 [Anaerolineaceae bacterium 4572_78]